MSWTTAPLSEVCDIVSGATPRTSVSDYWDGDIEWATPADLSKLPTLTIGSTARRITSAGLASCSATVLPAGSVLFSSRAPIGHVAINAVPMATNQGFKSLVPKPGVVDARYLAYWLRANKAYLQSLGTGATFKEVSKSVVSRVRVPIPPLAEQQRIAAILDQADALRAKRRQSLALLDLLSRATFVHMFGDPGTWPARWPMGTIGDTVESVTYGSSARAGSTGVWPILRMGNLTMTGRLDLRDLKYLDLSDKDVPKHTVRRGDLLFNRTNSPELVGKSAVVQTDMPLAYAGYLIRVRTTADHTTDYLSGYLNSRHGKAVLRGMNKAIIGQANINAKELQAIRIALPPTELQQRWSGQVAAIETERSRLEANLATLDELFAPLQSRAFSEELTLSAS